MNITGYLTGGLALAVAVVYGLWTYNARIDAAKLEAAQAMLDVATQQIAQAKAANESNVATLTAIQADLARQQAATIKAEAQSRDRAFALSKALKRISDAPKTEDGPVAGVLRDTLDQLRIVPGSGPTADSNHQGPSPAAPGPAEPAVPATPAAPTS